MPRRYSNVIGFDDAPFSRTHRGAVSVVGAVYAGSRLDGVLVGRVQRDGADAAHTLAALVAGSKFAEHVQLVILQGIAFAGLNVVDVPYLHDALGCPVLVVARRRPDLSALRRALGHVAGAERKWTLIEALGPMEPLAGVYVQRMGLDVEEARQVLETFTHHGHLPEPVRTAHLIAGALETGSSHGRA